MEISRVQEEILLVLHNSDRELCGQEILKVLNSDRPKAWRKIKGASLYKILERMIVSQLVEISRIVEKDCNKKYYKILDEGFWSILQAEANRNRLNKKKSNKN